MMKKRIFLMLGIVAMLASCSQGEDLLPKADGTKVRMAFNLKTENSPQTRATVEGLVRYCIEVYAGADTSVDPIYSDHQNTTGQFEVSFYATPENATILFWADYGSEYYDVSGGLKQIAMQTGATATDDNKAEAFFYKLTDFNLPGGGTQEPTTVILKRAVAQVVLTETEGLAADKNLTATFNHYPQFNVATETAIGEKTSRTVTFTFTNAVAAKAEIGRFYAFAPKAEQNLEAFTFGYDGQTRELANVPLQANYRTLITGKFDPRVEQQFNITCDDAWNTPDLTGSWLKIGEDYTHTANDRTYNCIVVSAEYTKAAVAYKTELPNFDDVQGWGGAYETYNQALENCQTYGGRLLTESEFKVMVEKGVIKGADAKHLFLEGNKCASYVGSGWSIGDILNTSMKAMYYLVFELKSPNL